MSVRVESSLSRLKKLGQRLLANQNANVKAQPIPADVAAERRAGRRAPLPLEIRIKLSEDDDPRRGKIRDVNMTGLAVEPSLGAQVDDRVHIGFDGYPDVCPGFALVGRVKRILEAEEPGETSAMGLEIDREQTSADAQKKLSASRASLPASPPAPGQNEPRLHHRTLYVVRLGGPHRQAEAAVFSVRLESRSH